MPPSSRLPGIGSPGSQTKSSPSGRSDFQFPACKGAMDMPTLRASSRTPESRRSMCITNGNNHGPPLFVAKSPMSPKRPQRASKYRPKSKQVGDRTNNQMLTFLEETAILFNKLEAARKAGEKDTEIMLKIIMEDTSDAKSELANWLNLLETEREEIIQETALIMKCYAHGDQLYRTSSEIDAARDKYPDRCRFELGIDRVSSAVAEQSEQVQTTRTVMEQRRQVMEDSRKENEDLQATLRIDMETKQAGFNADRSALTLQKGTTVHGNLSPASGLDHDKWIANINSVLNKALQCIQYSSKEREAAVKLRKQRAEAEITAASKLVEVMLDKQNGRRQQLNFLRSKLQRLHRHDEKLQKSYVELSQNQLEMQASLAKAEARLLARNERPTPECKSDDAEEFLLSEINKLKEMLEELQRHKERMEAEIQKTKEEKSDTQAQLQAAEDARDIDAACMQMECHGSLLHECHKWLTAMVNYEYGMNLIPHCL